MPEVTARTAESPQQAKGDTDARQWEYTTYAPAGETCPACERPIMSLEICRRAASARPDTAPVAAYWHTDCAPVEAGR